MAAVASVMLALCLIVNAANFLSTDAALSEMLQSIRDNQGKVPFPGPGEHPGMPGGGQFTPETPYSTRFFVLRYTSGGTLIKADLDIILSDIDGFYDANPNECPTAKLVPVVDHIDKGIIAAAGAAGSSVGSGGMVTKIRAARALAVAGIPLVICSGDREDAIVDAAFGKDVGTFFPAAHLAHEITPRKLWIALGDSARGKITVDDGAKHALVKQGSSLLTVGVAGVEGSFDTGDVVDILDSDGYLFARGLVSAERDRVELAIGKTHSELAGNRILADLAETPLIHRDDMVVFE